MVLVLDPLGLPRRAILNLIVAHFWQLLQASCENSCSKEGETASFQLRRHSKVESLHQHCFRAQFMTTVSRCPGDTVAWNGLYEEHRRLQTN